MNKLAIVIPYYKIDFFEETLKSIASQSDKHFTLYIGNDASPNDPLPLIKQYFEEEDYHYFDYKNNLGGQNLAMQWERILENVSEEWFQILGDDDMIADNFVEELNKSITKTNNGVVRVNRKVYNEDNILIREDFIDKDIIDSVQLLSDGYQRKTVTSLSEFIFYKKKYDQIKFTKIPLAWGTDVLAFLEFSDFKSITLINTTNVLIKVTDKSITGNSTDLVQKKEEAFNIFRKILLEKYFSLLPNDIRNILIKDYFSCCWKSKFYPEISLYKIYLKKGNLIEFLKKSITKYKVIKQIKSN